MRGPGPARRRALAVAVAALLGAGCRTPAVARLRVDPPPARPGAEPGAGALSVERALREVSVEERLACRESAGPVVLTCSPGDVGTRTAQVTVELLRAGAGYEVSLTESVLPPLGRPEGLCALQRRIARAIDAEAGMPVTRIDPRSRCQE